MVVILGINLFLSILISSSVGQGKKLSHADYKSFSKEFAECLKNEDVECLEKLTMRDVYFTESEKFGCKKDKLTAKEFVECALRSTKKYGDEPGGKTLNEVLFKCYTDSSTKIHTKSMYFDTNDGFHCSVREENGKLKLENVMAGE